ncbi:hypothetical protein CVD28_19395 [Bacillus sp. M6-12]|nr:hypothetical protein CVD28_19395 [Bacillus sp. M6-12]
MLEVNIKQDVVDPDDIEMLQDSVLAATNDALKKADKLTNHGAIYNGKDHSNLLMLSVRSM